MEKMDAFISVDYKAIAEIILFSYGLLIKALAICTLTSEEFCSEVNQGKHLLVSGFRTGKMCRECICPLQTYQMQLQLL